MINLIVMMLETASKQKKILALFSNIITFELKKVDAIKNRENCSRISSSPYQCCALTI